MSNDDFKRFCQIHGGGYKCYCCGPSPKNRKWFRRTVRHRIANAVRKEIATAIVEGV